MVFQLVTRYSAVLSFTLLTACSQMPRTLTLTEAGPPATISIEQLLENARHAAVSSGGSTQLHIRFSDGSTQLHNDQRKQIEAFSARFDARPLTLNCGRASAADAFSQTAIGLSRCHQLDIWLSRRHPLTAHMDPSLPSDTAQLQVMQ